MEFAIDYVLIPFIKILVVFLIVSVVVAYLTLAERKVAAFIQVLLGPMRVGPYGLLQPIADGLKLMLKRESDAEPAVLQQGPAPDQFRARGLVIRFQRDASKKVIALTVDAGRVRDIRFTRTTR